MTPKEQLIEALKALCARAGGHVVVADTIGANEQTLWQIVNGTKLPSGQPRGVGPQLQTKLEKHYPGWSNSLPANAGGNVAHLESHRRTKIPPNNREGSGGPAEIPATVLIPQYETGGSMGNGGLVLRDQPGLIHSWKVSREWLNSNVRNATSPSNLCIVTGFGDSMRPLYNPGDPLLVDRGVTEWAGDAIYFFRMEGEGFIKRLQLIPGQGILVISENKAYRDWTIQRGSDFEILGRVLKVWRGEEY